MHVNISSKYWEPNWPFDLPIDEEDGCPRFRCKKRWQSSGKSMVPYGKPCYFAAGPLEGNDVKRYIHDCLEDQVHILMVVAHPVTLFQFRVTAPSSPEERLSQENGQNEWLHLTIDSHEHLGHAHADHCMVSSWMMQQKWCFRGTFIQRLGSFQKAIFVRCFLLKVYRALLAWNKFATSEINSFFGAKKHGPVWRWLLYTPWRLGSWFFFSVDPRDGQFFSMRIRDKNVWKWLDMTHICLMGIAGS